MLNTVHNLITFSIVFSNKNGMDRFNPPPTKNKKNVPPLKLRLRTGSGFLVSVLVFLKILFKRKTSNSNVAGKPLVFRR